MPPSIPSPGVVSDAAAGVATSRLPLIRETTKNLKEGTAKMSRRQPSARRKLDSMKNTGLRKNKLKSGRTFPTSSRRLTSAKNENSFDSNSKNATDSSLGPISASSESAGVMPYGGISTVSPYGFYGGAASMMPPSPFLGMGMNTMGLPYLSGLNQIVFNMQNIIFSISQAIHVLGANQEALQHAWESLNQMVDHAVSTFHEMRTLESMEHARETEEERKKRKRLKALRYAFVFGGSWLAYKLIRNLLFRKRSPQHRQIRQVTPKLFGENHNGQSNFDNMPIWNYSSPNNLHGAINTMGYPGNYNGMANGYY